MSLASFDFSPTLSRMIATGTVENSSGEAIPVVAASTINNLLVLRNLHMETKAAKTLEVGLAHGASALVFAQSHQDLGHVATGQHVAIDPWQQALWAGSALETLHRSSLGDFVTLIEKFSDSALPNLVDAGHRFDLIYIDGSHLFEDVFVDTHYAVQLLNLGGIMLLDDSADPHVAKVVRFLRTNMADAVVEVDVSRYRADKGQTLKYRLARRLGKAQLTAFKKVGNERRQWNSKLQNF